MRIQDPFWQPDIVVGVEIYIYIYISGVMAAEIILMTFCHDLLSLVCHCLIERFLEIEI